MKDTKQTKDKALRKSKYKSTFLKPTEFVARKGKTVYINKEFHQKLSLLVLLSSNRKITLADYLNNLLQHHFEEYGAEMKSLYDKIEKLTF
jgi:hypothetical protein